MAPISSSLPLGERIPPHEQHAISSSLPTWESVGALIRGESWVLPQMKAGYPRFHLNEEVQRLNGAVLARLGLATGDGMACMVFVSTPGAARCVEMLKTVSPDAKVSTVRFFQPGESSCETKWAQFHAVIYPTEAFETAFKYWRDSGDGISTRHAEFCLPRFDYLQSESAIQAHCTSAVKTTHSPSEHLPRLQTSGAAESESIKQDIARLVRSGQESQGPVTSNDVFLYPGGMSAINAVARVLTNFGIKSGVVAFGWLYTETTKVIEHCWPDHRFYGTATSEELDELEASLKSGKRINALWTELPGNPKLVTPDMHRIRRLADEYDFLVICDETVGTFINTDVLPYVDVLMTSLTKMYNGYCDVLGGSVVVNPQSSRYDQLHHQLTVSDEDTFFPTNIAVLNKNSQNFAERVDATNRNAKAIADRVSAHPAVERVNYPSITTPELYERYRRPGGGYGHLMSIVFQNPASGVRFYNTLNVCKGPSFGTCFTLSIAYSQLGTPEEQLWLERHGIPKHLVRISIGLEDLDVLWQTIAKALKEVERFESENAGVAGAI